jgi:hypothetical protein
MKSKRRPDITEVQGRDDACELSGQVHEFCDIFWFWAANWWRVGTAFRETLRLPSVYHGSDGFRETLHPSYGLKKQENAGVLGNFED